MEAKHKLISRLLEVGVVKLGKFVLKSGALSPIYIDLRIIVTYPDIIRSLSELIWAEKTVKDLDADVICGVPYTALPLASALAVSHNVPMVMKRKETKKHGTRQMVEGVFQKNQKCLIIEDIVSSGSSVIETADALRREGLIVTDCVVIIDRKQGGSQNLADRGLTLHSIFDLESIISALSAMNIVTPEEEKELKIYFKVNSFIAIKKLEPPRAICIRKRKEVFDQLISKKLFDIIDAKETNLCVAVDVILSDELLSLADKLGPHICILKTHIDILSDFTEEVITKLRILAEKHNFLIFEDRKFADIGNTVKYQYGGGLYKISDWADIVTVHCFPGEAIVDALKSVPKNEPRACVLIAQMSSKGAIASNDYVKKAVEVAEKNADFVIGFISQSIVSENIKFIHMCPGVSIDDSGDSFGQQYKSPEKAIENGADVIIVGRGITNANHVVEAAEEYKSRAFVAYKRRIDLYPKEK